VRGPGKEHRMILMEQVKKRIEEERLIDQGDVVVVAVSGGPDSVALLHVLFLLSKDLGWRLIVAHVNHQFRGAESDAEAEFVRKLATDWGLICEVGTIDVPSYIEATLLNTQVASREKRYEFLHQVAETYSAQRIALAHHADDQAETVLMRIIRGTGPSGLSGIHERRREKKVELIRPLLRIYKSELNRHCLDHGLAYCMDSSNELRKYFRNQVRLDIMPMLQTYNDQLPESLNRLAEMMHAEDSYMEEETVRIFAEIVISNPSGYRFLRHDFARLPVALQRRLIKLILNYLTLGLENVDFARIELIRSAILQGKTSNVRLDISERLCLVREYDDIRFQPPFAPVGAYVYQMQIEPGSQVLLIPEADMKLCVTIHERKELGLKPPINHVPSYMDVIFDLDMLELPLTVRSRIDGDRMEPLGLNGTKKVKDMFIDAKIPPSRRDVIPLVVDAKGQVLWIPGLRSSKHAPVIAQTQHYLHMKLLSL
jgi:tRNA(Ile)-lysidine synthase